MDAYDLFRYKSKYKKLGVLSSVGPSSVFLSDVRPTLETLDSTIRIGSTPTFLYFDLYLYSANAAHDLFGWMTRFCRLRSKWLLDIFQILMRFKFFQIQLREKELQSEKFQVEVFNFELRYMF